MDLLNSPLLKNLENGQLPTVNMNLVINEKTIMEIGIALGFAIIFAAVVFRAFGFGGKK